MKDLITELESKVKNCHNTNTIFDTRNYVLLDDVRKLLEAINYTHCCKSDSEQLPDVEKKQLIEDAYWLNLQNLSGREDFEEAFKLGIETGVDETLEKLQG